MKEKVKQIVKETMQPLFDNIVDTTTAVFSAMANNMPSSMSDDEKITIIKDIIKQQNDSIIAGIKGSIPTDLESKMKEAYSGGK